MWPIEEILVKGFASFYERLEYHIVANLIWFLGLLPAAGAFMFRGALPAAAVGILFFISFCLTAPLTGGVFYYVNGFMEGHPFDREDLWEGVRRFGLRSLGLLAAILWPLVAGAVAAVATRGWVAQLGLIGTLLQSLIFLVMMFDLLAATYALPVLVKDDCTVKEALQEAVRLSFEHMPVTSLVALVLVIMGFFFNVTIAGAVLVEGSLFAAIQLQALRFARKREGVQ